MIRWLWNIFDPAVTVGYDFLEPTYTPKVPLWQRLFLGRGRGGDD